MFLHLTTVLLSSPVSLSASRVMDVMSGATRLYPPDRARRWGRAWRSPPFEVLLGDRVAVDDHRGVGLEPFAVGLECRGVHRHQHVAVVAGVEFAVIAEMYLKSRNARDGALRCPDFGGIVREGGDAISQQRRRVGEERARELHAVARVAREADHDVLQFAYIGFVHDRMI